MAGQKGRNWVSEDRLRDVLLRMTRDERAIFLMRYALLWREAVLAGRISGRTGGELLRESESRRKKQDKRH